MSKHIGFIDGSQIQNQNVFVTVHKCMYSFTHVGFSCLKGLSRDNYFHTIQIFYALTLTPNTILTSGGRCVGINLRYYMDMSIQAFHTMGLNSFYSRFGSQTTDSHDLNMIFINNAS